MSIKNMFEHLPDRVNSAKDFFLEIIGLKKDEPTYLETDREYFETLNQEAKNSEQTLGFCPDCFENKEHAPHSSDPMRPEWMRSLLNEEEISALDFTPPIGDPDMLNTELAQQFKTISSALTSYVDSVERTGGYTTGIQRSEFDSEWSIGQSWFEDETETTDFAPTWPIDLSADQREALWEDIRKDFPIPLQEHFRADEECFEAEVGKEETRSAYSRYIAKNMAPVVQPTEVCARILADMRNAIRIHDEFEDFTPDTSSEMPLSLRPPIEQSMLIETANDELMEKKMSEFIYLANEEFEAMLTAVVHRVEEKMQSVECNSLTFDRHLGFFMTNQTERNCENWLKETAVQASTPMPILLHLAKSNHPGIRAAVAHNPKVPVNLVLELARDAKSEVRCAAASSQNLPAITLHKLAEDDNCFVQLRAAETLKRTESRAA